MPITESAELPIEPIAPRRGPWVERGTWGVGFYKIGMSWVIYLKMPRFGMIHCSHWSLWRCIILFPRMFFGLLRIALFGRPRKS